MSRQDQPAAAAHSPNWFALIPALERSGWSLDVNAGSLVMRCNAHGRTFVVPPLEPVAHLLAILSHTSCNATPATTYMRP